ncbi:hypothetical protein K1719_034187 [Acacia pycnantha]|nr:hypothetical protein K1719_034187 [Acacia pycnantha]
MMIGMKGIAPLEMLTWPGLCLLFPPFSSSSSFSWPLRWGPWWQKRGHASLRATASRDPVSAELTAPTFAGLRASPAVTAVASAAAASAPDDDEPPSDPNSVSEWDEFGDSDYHKSEEELDRDHGAHLRVDTTTIVESAPKRGDLLLLSNARSGRQLLTVTEERLAALFSSCGQVIDCRICGDTHSILRFAFVEFADERGARAALNLSGTVLGYYPVKVLPSKTAILPMNPTFLPRFPPFSSSFSFWSPLRWGQKQGRANLRATVSRGRVPANLTAPPFARPRASPTVTAVASAAVASAANHVN